MASGTSRRELQSFVVSVTLHTALLLVLSWFVVRQVQQRSISLTMSTRQSDAGQTLVTMATPEQSLATDLPLDQSGYEPISEFSSPQLLDASDLHSPLKPKAVEFFGTHAYGKRFVFVLDRSISMSVRRGDRFDRARAELIRSISNLSPSQSYCVYLFCYDTTSMFHPPRRFHRLSTVEQQSEFVPATAENLKRLEYWLDNMTLDSGTDPRRALSLAYLMEPDAIFLLSDGSFNRRRTGNPREGWKDELDIPQQLSVPAGVQLRMSDIPLHTIAFENPFTRATMAELAELTGGSSRYIKTRSLEPMSPAVLVDGLRMLVKVERTPNTDPETPFLFRINHAQTLIEDGELAFAEYLLRPCRSHRFTGDKHQGKADQMFEILDEELGETRLEDFEQVSLAEIHKLVSSGRRLPRFNR